MEKRAKGIVRTMWEVGHDSGVWMWSQVDIQEPVDDFEKQPMLVSLGCRYVKVTGHSRAEAMNNSKFSSGARPVKEGSLEERIFS